MAKRRKHPPAGGPKPPAEEPFTPMYDSEELERMFEEAEKEERAQSREVKPEKSEPDTD